jgi:Tol biopolymer transport system component
VYVARSDGSRPRRVAFGFTPAWSPDSKRLALAVPSRGIHVIELASGRLQQITKGPADVEPDWSPDRTRIAFRRGRVGPDSEIFIVNAHGSDLKRLTDDSEHSGFPDWAP